MNTKLTLTIDKFVIEKAKKYARNKERSLSDLIENYLKSLVASEGSSDENELTPIVDSLRGSFKSDKDFDYKKDLTDSLAKKHL